MKAAIEAILFVAGEPITLAELALALDCDTKTAKVLVTELTNQYKEEKRGILIAEIDGKYQMCTNPDCFTYIKKVYEQIRPKNLSPVLLETLAIIAYRQPVTKGHIEEIRGVSADHAVNRLVEYGLVSEKGRLDAPGRPILFGTSDEFLRHFQLSNLTQLPKLPENADGLPSDPSLEAITRHTQLI